MPKQVEVDKRQVKKEVIKIQVERKRADHIVVHQSQSNEKLMKEKGRKKTGETLMIRGAEGRPHLERKQKVRKEVHRIKSGEKEGGKRSKVKSNSKGKPMLQLQQPNQMNETKEAPREVKDAFR